MSLITLALKFAKKVKIIKYEWIPFVSFALSVEVPLPTPNTHTHTHTHTHTRARPLLGSFWLLPSLGEHIHTHRTQISYLCIESYHFLPHLKSVPNPTGTLVSAPSLESFSSALLPSGDTVPFPSPSHWQAAQSLLLLLPLPQKFLLCSTPMDFRLHHISETAFEATNALLVTKSKCLVLDRFLLLTFKETPTFSFLKVFGSLWSFLGILQASWLFHPPFIASVFPPLLHPFHLIFQPHIFQYRHSIRVW